LGEKEFEKTLEMLSGNYNAAEFIDLKPRIYWDRLQGTIRAEPYGKRLVYSSGGTIPDRGYFGVYLAGSGVKLGELEEEFVFERRLNERFVLGTSTWRIEEIRQDRVIVSPSRKGEAYIPFWKADLMGRVFELGKRIGGFYGEVETRLDGDDFNLWLQAECGIDETAARNIKNYLQAQKKAVGFIQTDKRLILEEYQDEAGEWRIALHSPFGARLHTALGYIIKDYWAGQYHYEAEMVAVDEALLFHCPGGQAPPVIEWADFSIENLERQVAGVIGSSVLFGTVFRHCAQRSLVMPRTGYGKKRMPLWLARLKAGNLLQVVARYRDFPLIVETYREILRDFFDLAGLREVVSGIQQGKIEVHHCRRGWPSPFAMGHMLNFVGSFMYENDAPKGERHLQLFGLGRDTLKTIVGEQGFRDLFAGELIGEVDRKARGVDNLENDPSLERLLYWLERAGDVAWEELDGLFPTANSQIKARLRELVDSGKAAEIRSGPGDGNLVVAGLEAPVYGDALCSPTFECRGTSSEARRRIIQRFAGTHGPFTASAIVNRYHFNDPEVAAELAVLAVAGVIEAGEFIPGGSGEEWCDAGLLKEIHRRSLARARKEVEARKPEDYAAFLAKWQGITPFAADAEAMDQLAEVLKQLSNLWLPADLWEKSIFPVRIKNYRANLLDQLIGSGQFTWRAGFKGATARIRFEPVLNEAFSLLPVGAAKTENASIPSNSESHWELTGNCLRIMELLRSGGALSLPRILKSTGLGTAAAWKALEELLMAGIVSNDTFGPARYILNTQPEDRQGVRGIIKPALMNTMGRWSVLAPENEDTPEIIAYSLLNRYGIVSREAVLEEDLVWDELYPVLDLLESAGKIRRGYFVTGLSGIQYALPEAVERLRREPGASLWILAWQDPANAYRLFPEWPGLDISGVSADYLAYQSGEPVLVAAGKKLKIRQLKELPPDTLEKALQELFRYLYPVYRDQKITIIQYNSQPVNESDIAPLLIKLGFETGYQEMVLWPSRRL
jgi:ATP-dependent Lhr-like helicase